MAAFSVPNPVLSLREGADDALSASASATATAAHDEELHRKAAAASDVAAGGGVYLRWEGLCLSVKLAVAPSSGGPSATSGAKEDPSAGITPTATTATTTTLQLLTGVSGWAGPGDVVAILGASGAGKTTLLNVLGGRGMGGLSLSSGRVTVNGQLPGSDFPRLCGYVTQDTPLFDALTVRETLTYATRLRLPEDTPAEEKRRTVESLLEQLDLVSCASTLVGKVGEAGGISGGERRRLALACELAFKPALLLCDEITSGLDSASAARTVRALKRLAVEGRRTVLCTIHQPRAALLGYFTKLLVLGRGGRVIYFGPSWGGGGAAAPLPPSISSSSSPIAASPAASPSGLLHPAPAAGSLVDYFASVGYPLPAYENPADAVLDLVNAEDGREDEEEDGEVPAGSQGGGKGTTKRREARKSRAQIIEELAAAYIASDLCRAAEGGPDPSAVRAAAEARFAAAAEAAAAEGAGSRNNSSASARQSGRRYPTSLWTQIWTVCQRAFLFKLRNPDAVVSQAVSSVVMCVVVGSIFWKLAPTQAGARDRLSAIAFFALTQSFMCFDQVVLLPAERAVMLREAGAGLYSTFAFYCGRTLAELPPQVIFGAVSGAITHSMFGLREGTMGVYVLIILLLTLTGASALLLVSALSNSMAMGNALATLVLVFASLFNGFFVLEANTPAAYKWIAAVAFPGHGVKAAVAVEMRGLALTCTPEEAVAGCAADGGAILLGLGLAGVDEWRFCGYLAAQAVIMRLLAFVALHFCWTGAGFKERLRILLKGR